MIGAEANGDNMVRPALIAAGHCGRLQSPHQYQEHLAQAHCQSRRAYVRSVATLVASRQHGGRRIRERSFDAVGDDTIWTGTRPARTFGRRTQYRRRGTLTP
jgi:hypothetical protein